MSEEVGKSAGGSQDQAKGARSPNGRRSRWQSSLAAINYLSSISKNEELKVRVSDRVTGIALMMTSIITVLCLVLRPASPLRLAIMVLCDFFLAITLAFYIINRLGILTTLAPRQAILILQLLKAFTFIGVFLTINLAILVSLALSNVPF